MKKSTAQILPDTQILTFDSQSPSATHPFDGVQDTVLLFDDTEVLDSQQETERLDDLGFDDTEGQVVLDSEDEEMIQTGSGRVCCESKKIGGFKKLHFDSMVRPQSKSPEATDSYASFSEQCGDGKSLVNCPSISRDNCDQPQLHVCDLNLDTLNYTRSEDPGESTQAQALDFVDQFVLYNDENLSQRENVTKSSGKKSPLISRAKGTCILAQRLRTQTANIEAFQWDDSKQLVQESVPCKKIETSLLDNNKVTHLEGEIYNKEPEDKKDHMELAWDEKEYNMKTGEVFDPKPQLEGPDFMEDTADVYDIGVNTQIAAEAMEALFYGLPTGCNEKDAYRDPNNTCDSPQRFETNSALNLGNSIPQESLYSDVEFIPGKSKQGKQSALKFYQRKTQNPSKRQKLDSKLVMTEKVKRENLLAGKRVTFESPAYTDKQGVVVDGIGKEKLKTIDVTEGGIITYRRKRTARNGKFVQQKQTKREEAGISIFLELDPWNIPRRKRTCLKVEKNLNRAGDLLSTLRAVLGNERNIQYVKGLKSADEKAMSSNLISNTVLWSPKDNCPVQLTSEYNADVRQDPDRQGSANTVIHYEMTARNDILPSMQQDLVKAYNRTGSSRGVDSISFVNDAKGSIYSRATSIKKAEISGFISAKTVEGIKDKNVETSDYNCHEHNRKPCSKNLPKSSLLKELMKLGAHESIPSPTWKDLRKRRDTTCIRVLFSQHLDDDVLKQQKKIAARLGISVTVYSKDATHFVADNFVRTRNMLEAIALGKPVVTHLWLDSCGQAGYFIDEKKYVLRDARKEKEIGFNMPVSLSRASYQPLLKGYRLFITPRIKPDEETIASLVYAVHGQTAERNQMSAGNDKKFPDDLLILSCEEDYAICKPFLEKGAMVYSSELLLNGIVIQKLEFERHQLFKNHVKKNNRRRRLKKYAG